MSSPAGMIAIGMGMLLYALHNVSYGSPADAVNTSEIPLLHDAALEIGRDSRDFSQ
jgi:hypothetical protein